MKKAAKLLVVSLLSMVFVFASAALATSETKIEMHVFEEGNMDYFIQLQDGVKFQRIQGNDEEFGAIDVVAVVLKTPEFDSPIGLGKQEYTFMTNNPHANRLNLSFESYFGGQFGVAEAVEMIDGSYSSFISVSTTTAQEHIFFVRASVYDLNSDEGSRQLFSDTGVNFIFDSFAREGFTRTDVDISEQTVVDPDHDTTEPIRAKPTTSKVLVNGEDVSFQAYNISGNNYFKLRDLAMVLSGTEKSFEVGWDAVRNLITLESGKAYTAVGGELVVSEKPEIEKGRLSTSAILLDGKTVELTAYLIKGNNYFKLRDVADVLDFGVTWNGETRTIGIDSSTSYVPE